MQIPDCRDDTIAKKNQNSKEKLNGYKATDRSEETCNADVCDYWIVGDESEAAKAHPKKTDDKGYWYND